jgi:hypothetical protein
MVSNRDGSKKMNNFFKFFDFVAEEKLKGHESTPALFCQVVSLPVEASINSFQGRFQLWQPQ